MVARLRAMGQPKYRRGFQVTLHRGELARPPRWRKPRKVFVNSMSDLFHEAVPAGFIGEVFAVMARCRRHTFQVLTKRLHEPFLQEMEWPANVWMGVSIESERHLSRAAMFRMTGARVQFLSLEPLLGPRPGLDLDGIDWVIAGGESGPGARPMAADWVRDIRDKCLRAGVAFFFKQWGGTNKKRAGRVLDGRTWDRMPERRGSTAAGEARAQAGALSRGCGSSGTCGRPRNPCLSTGFRGGPSERRVANP